MSDLDDAIAQVVSAVDVLEAAKTASEAPVETSVDPVWTDVQNVLTSNGWAAPTPVSDPSVAEDTTA